MRPFGLIARSHGSFCTLIRMSTFVTLRSASISAGDPGGRAHSYCKPYAALSSSRYYVVTLTPLGVARLYSWSGAAAMLASARLRMGVRGMAKWLPMVVSLESMAGDATGL
jgi:hypothetical protein